MVNGAPIYTIDGFVIENNKQIRCFLSWDESGPFLIKKDGDILQTPETVFFTNTSISMIAGKPTIRALKQAIGIILKPLHKLKQSYNPDSTTSQYTMNPPPTEGWMYRVLNGEVKAELLVEATETDGIFWLTILDDEKHSCFEFHMIYQHELNYLLMETDYSFLTKTVSSSGFHDMRTLDEELDNILQAIPPPMSAFDFLLSKSRIPSFRLKRNLDETLDQILPSELIDPKRKELKVFLSLVVSQSIKIENAQALIKKYEPYGYLTGLLSCHARCLYDGLGPPPYFKIIVNVSRGLSRRPRFAIVEGEESVGMQIWREIEKQSPDWRGRALKYVMHQKDLDDIFVTLPIEEGLLDQSYELQKDKFALESLGYYLHTTINPHSFGLRVCVYTGSAYLWPLKYTVWQLHLEESTGKTRNMELLLLPPTPLSQLMTIRTKLVEISWMSRRTNPQLFNARRRRWTIRKKRVINAMSRSISASQLEKQYSSWSVGEFVFPNELEARVLDLTASNLYLDVYNSKRVKEYLGITPKDIKEVLQSYYDIGAIDIAYRPALYGLITICVITRGLPGRIYSVADAFLKHLPSAQVMITKKGDMSISLLRIPLQDVTSFSDLLLSNRSKTKLTFDIGVVRLYKSYLHNLFQRIRSDDSAWIEDISDAITQTSEWRKRHTSI